MHARFYAPDLAPGAEFVRLPAEEAEHLTRVLRLRAGAEVRVFSGRGYECAGRVEAIDRRAVTVRVGRAVSPAPEPSVPIVLAQAVPKGDAMDAIVRDSVMLGVAAIVPIVSARTEARLEGPRSAGRVSRWRRIAIASAKQCLRAVVPDVHDMTPFASCLTEPRVEQRFLLAEPTLRGTPRVSVRALSRRPAPASALLAVGPEGGWTDEEAEVAAAAGCIAITLGRRTLRADAAALVAIAALQCVWGDLDS